MIVGRTPLQIAVVAIPSIVWIAFAVRRPKTVRGWVIGWLMAFTITACAAIALLRISN